MIDVAVASSPTTRIKPEDIASVSCRTAEGPVPRLWEPLPAKHRPPNGYASKFSLPYLLAVILVKGRATLADFTDDAVRDAAVLQVSDKVGYEIDPTIDYPRQFVGHVAITLRDGRVIEERQDHPRGGPDFPMTRADLEAKFHGNATLAVSADQAACLIRVAAELATATSIAELALALAT